MVIYNAKAVRKLAGTKNRGYMTAIDQELAVESEWVDIPRYEEMTYLRMDSDD